MNHNTQVVIDEFKRQNISPIYVFECCGTTAIVPFEKVSCKKCKNPITPTIVG